MIPSVKTIQSIRGVDAAKAREVRAAMQAAVDAGACDRLFANRAARREVMSRIDEIIGGYGVEFIARGTGSRSPAIRYVNMGDTYDATVMLIDGRFRVGCWGDIVERGSYA